MLSIKNYVLYFCLLLIAGLAPSTAFAKRETGFLNRSAKVGGQEYRYQVYLPANYTKDRRWPVIVFLHGSGERGSDGLVQTEVGIGGAIRRHVERFPAIVVLPQCRKGVWWSAPEMEAQVMKALEQTVKEFKGDEKRLYLTGLSMGGYGTWSLAAKYPGKFAALVPVCGGVRVPPAIAASLGTRQDESVDPYLETAKKIGQTPVWVFHGDADPAVPVTESRKMVEAIKATGGNVKYNEYPGVGHNSWDKAYAEPDLLPWLLSQTSAR